MKNVEAAISSRSGQYKILGQGDVVLKILGLGGVTNLGGGYFC